MSLTSVLAGQVSETIRNRGREYFRSGAVRVKNARYDTVDATVQGTDRYEVGLTLEGNTVFAYCDCPYLDEYRGACKHIWATLLAVENRGFASSAALSGRLRLAIDGQEDDYEDEYDAPPAQVYRPHYAAPAPRPAPDQPWKKRLEALHRQLELPAGTPAADPGERRVLFVFDAPATETAQQLVIELAIQGRKKNGEWAKPKAQGVPSNQIAGLPDPLDRQLLTLLGGAARGDSYGYYNDGGYGYGPNRYRPGPLLLDTVFPLLEQSGRVFLRTEPKGTDLVALTPDPGPPWELKVAVTEDRPRKRWVLDGALVRGEERMPLGKPALLAPGVVAWDGRFARLDDGGAFAWVSVLRRQGAVAVPAEKAEDLVAHLVQMPRLPRIDLPDKMRVTEDAVAPRPRLVIKAAKSYYRTDPVLHAELSFNYDGEVIPANAPPGRGIYQKDRRRLILRDLPAEQAAGATLNRLGFRLAWAGGGQQKLEISPTRLPKVVKELVPAGWIVDAEGKLYRPAGAFNLNVKSGQDWFDLNATADFGGKEVSLPRLLEALAKGESTVPLDDGTFGMVPEEWLKKYGLIAKLGTVEGDALRFSRAQVGVLDALLASRPEVSSDQQFARARDQLRKFAGVEPADPPKGFTGELREYQREGLGWLRFLRKFGFGGCLADDMGLGKTVQVLAYLAGKRGGPALVVVPKSLVFNWKQEAAKFAPNLKVLDHTGTARDRSGAGFKDHDLVITTYGTLRNDAAVISEFPFDTCVLDESQAVKNADTESAKAVRLIKADHRLALSGTPVENHLGELWSLFEFLNPGLLGRASLFAGGGAARNPDPETRELLAKALKPYILRRTKDQVAKDLPAKTEQTVYCDLEPKQRELYDELRDHYRQSLLARVDSVGLGRAKIQVLEALLRLRQAACHPGLIDKKRAGEDSAKLDVLLPQLAELVESGHKVLVFSQFTSLLAIVKARLDADDVPYEYLDGRTRDRAARVERFQTDPECRLFLISLKAGGVGLNLTAAEYVFLLDPWWNPAVEAQAIDRTHRIGQTKPVFAYRLIARDTVEEKVLALQASKRALADAILGGDGSLITDLKREDLELLLS